MTRFVSTILFVAVSSPLVAQPPATQEPLVAQVKNAIDRGVHFLRQKQRNDGSWEISVPVMEGGQTTLAILALLNSGVSPKDPAVQGGLKYIRQLESNKTYIRALQAMALAEANLPEDRQLLRDHAKWLIQARVMNGNKLLGWDYSNKSSSIADGSNTQYAVLGLWAAKHAGIDIPKEVWESIRDYYLNHQDGKRGSWIYAPGELSPSNTPSLTMTTAGVSGLLIAGMELNAGREIFEGAADTARNCGVYAENAALDRGMSWVASKFTLQLPPRTFYHLYGLERAGRLSGSRFIGEYDWYREGAQELVRLQKSDGSWHLDRTWDQWPVVSTSLSLLFLSKGRTPVLVSKIVHGAWPRLPGDTDWNNDRNDLRHLVRHASEELFHRQPLAWQTFDLMRAAVPRGGRENLTDEDLQRVTSEMLQSPMLYITGHESPRFRFTATEKSLLKRYIDNGGFIFAEACCGSKAFDQGFKQLITDIWPDYELAPVPLEHPVWTNPTRVAPGQPYTLFGMSQGCKTVLLYAPQDLSCRWEVGKQDDARCVQAFRLGLNIIAYATGMQTPQPRLTQVQVASDKGDPAVLPRGILKIAQLKHGPDWQPAPRAMRNLMEHVHNHAGLDVALKTETRPLYDRNLLDFKFLYMHGRDHFTFDRDALEPLRFNLKSGGLLFADACCGKEGFDKAFRELAAALFPGAKLERVPLDDELFRKDLSGEALNEQTVRCRFDVGKEFQNAPPHLEGIKHDGRWVILYSKYDIGCALEKHQAPDCRGYDHDSALKIARAAVLYLLRP